MNEQDVVEALGPLIWKQRYERPCHRHPGDAARSDCLHCLRRGWWLIRRCGSKATVYHTNAQQAHDVLAALVAPLGG
jgi:hypothetical protein